MKKFLSPQKTFIYFLLIFNLFDCIHAYSQAVTSCEQVEILFTPLVCYKPRQNPAGGQSDPKSCKPAIVCEDQSFQYESSISGLGYTYLWTAVGPSSVVFSPNNTSDLLNIIWTVPGVYTLSLTVTDANGNITTDCLSVTVKEKPASAFTFAPNNVCAGSTVCFSNNSTYTDGGMVYYWDFGDGNFSTQEDPCHVFDAAGTYQVCLITSSYETVATQGTQGGEGQTVRTCCSDTLCLDVVIEPGTLKIECTSTVCGNDPVPKIYHAIGCASPTWLNVIGGTIVAAAGDSVVIDWGNGATQGQITAQCGSGCIATTTVPIIPTAPIPVGNLVPCLNDISSYSLPILPGTFYIWSLINATTSTPVPIGSPLNPNFFTLPDNNIFNINWANIAPNGIDNYILNVTLRNRHICCESLGAITITPRDRFLAYSNQTICTGSSPNLFVSNQSTATTSTNYNWSVTPSAGVSPSTFTGQNFMPTFSNAGSYVVSVIETTNANCNSNVPQNVIVEVLPPTPNPSTVLGPTLICVGGIYTYTMSSAAPVGYHYVWSIFPTDGSFQPGTLFQVNGNSANIQWGIVGGTVTVFLERDVSPFCPGNSTTFTTTGAAPLSSVTGPTSVCVDSKLNYSTSDGQPATWTITPASQGTILLGQGTNTVEILWHGGSGAGPWTATSINITTACGSNTSFGSVTIYPKFTFTLSQSGDICDAGPPAGAQLTASAVANSPTYLWSPSGVTTNPSYTTSFGFNNLTVTNAGGCTFTKNIFVDDPFRIATNCSVGSCNGANMQHFLNVTVIKPGSTTLTNPFIYNWYSGIPGSGSLISTFSGTATSQSLTVTTPGDYYVEVKWKGCTKIITWNIPLVCCPDVNNPQITNVTQNTCFNFTFTGTIAPGSTAAFTWDFADGTPPVPNPITGIVSHTYTQAGIYCVKFCAAPPSPNPSGCTGNCTLTTVVVPIQAIFNAELGCNGNVYLTNNSINYQSPSFVTNIWDFGDGSPVVNTGTSTVPPAHSYASGGTYTITLTMNYVNGLITCSSSSSVTVTYNPLAISITSLPVCTNIPVLFSSNQLGWPSYNWDFGDGTNAFTPSSTHIYNATGPVAISLTVIDSFNNTCIANFTGTILTGSPCTLAPAYLCPDIGSTATLTAPSGTAYAWEQLVGSNWVPAAGVNNASTYTTTVVGTFRVKVTNANGCICTSNSVAVLLVTKPLAKIKVSPSRKLCGAGSLVTISSEGHASGDISTWYAGSIAPANEMTSFGSPNASIFGSINTTTNVILVITNQYGCTDTCTALIEVNPLPASPTIGTVPVTLCEGNTNTLTATSIGNNIEWSTGAIGISPLAITATASGQYSAVAVDPITGCKSFPTAIIVQKRPSVALFPHYCDILTCLCHDVNNPFAIYAPRPLFPFGPATSIQWFSGLPSTGVPIATGSSITPPILVSGSYYATITDPSAPGCPATTEPYTVVVPTATDCENCSCDNSSWGTITYSTVSPSATYVLSCGQTPESIQCSVPYQLFATYNCQPTGCDSYVTATITDPSMATNTYILPYVFTAPTTGLYSVVFTGYCNGKPCNTCRISFNACPPLDVNLISFTGKKIGQTVELAWESASEKHNNYYLIERSTDLEKFEKIGQVSSKNSNSLEKLTYEFTDLFPNIGLNFYRLKAIDKNGVVSNSKKIAIDFDENVPTKIYPNPTKADFVTLELKLNSESKLKLEWVDMLGRIIKTDQVIGNKGINKLNLNVSKLPVGKYFLNIIDETQKGKMLPLSFEKL
jgi:PKD repeat protein